jgi:deazaflavin-dependent oxidoreductase (nitroreductase family)
MSTTRYIAPNSLTRRLANPLVKGIVKLGFTPLGASILEVKGRTSGQWRAVPVNVITMNGHRYLVAPRGHTQWVRNIRVSGEGRLRTGRRRETIAVAELTHGDKGPILRAYLDRFGWEVAQFFEGLTVSASDAELEAVAPGFPVFQLI